MMALYTSGRVMALVVRAIDDERREIELLRHRQMADVTHGRHRAEASLEMPAEIA